jgi:predicted O-methyltransferase YrrM
VDLVHPAVDRYLHELAHVDDPVLQEMQSLAERRDFPIVGPQVGRLLSVLARAISARRVLELGSGFGYSAYWFARAVGPEGQVVLTESSADNAAQAAAFLARGGLRDRTRIEVGDALEIAGRVGSGYDIVFNDIDKRDYSEVPARAAAVLRPGGLLISDNMLWSGTVFDPGATDDAVRGVREMTRRLYGSEGFETVLVPLRDGVTVSVFGG